MDRRRCPVDLHVFRHAFKLPAHFLGARLGLDQAGVQFGQLAPLGIQVVNERRVARQIAQVLFLERVEALFSLGHLLLILAELRIQELPGRVEVAPGGAGVVLHVNPQQSLNDLVRRLRVFVREADREDVGAVGGQGDPFLQRRQQAGHFGLAGGVQVQVRHASNPFEVGATDQRALHQVDLLHGVDVDRQAAQQGPQQAFRIDVDLGRHLVFVGNHGDRGPAHGTENPGHAQNLPSPAPQRRQVPQQL